MELQERTVRRVKEGTAAALVKSGMSEELWNQATECCCHLRNICDTVADGKTAYQKLFNALSKSYRDTVWSERRVHADQPEGRISIG